MGPVVITKISHSACVVVEKHGFGLSQRNYSWDKTNMAVGSEGIIFVFDPQGKSNYCFEKKNMFDVHEKINKYYNVLFSIWWSSTIFLLQTNPIFFWNENCCMGCIEPIKHHIQSV